MVDNNAILLRPAANGNEPVARDILVIIKPFWGNVASKALKVKTSLNTKKSQCAQKVAH